MIVDILLFILFWVLGTAATSFLLIPPLIVLFFAIPFTIELKRKGIVHSFAPAYKYLVSFILLFGLFLIIIWAVWSYTNYFLAYLIGIAIILPSGLKKCGKNPDNLNEYLITNSDYINNEKLREHYAS